MILSREIPRVYRVRRALIYAQRIGGMTFGAIAEYHGISVTTATQIYKRYTELLVVPKQT